MVQHFILPFSLTRRPFTVIVHHHIDLKFLRLNQFVISKSSLWSALQKSVFNVTLVHLMMTSGVKWSEVMRFITFTPYLFLFINRNSCSSAVNTCRSKTKNIYCGETLLQCFTMLFNEQLRICFYDIILWLSKLMAIILYNLLEWWSTSWGNDTKIICNPSNKGFIVPLPDKF